MQSKLKIIFAGTPEFAATALKALLSSEHEVVAVYTQPDRPSGRGRKLTASSVKQLAQSRQIPVYQPETLKTAEAQAQIKKLNPDLMIVAAYGLMLPEAVLQMPAYGCINIHASLLPRWRGAAPIQHAILAGDAETGITIMQMDVGLDTGAMLKKVPLKISSKDTSATLHDKLANIGAEATLAVIGEIKTLTPEKQDNTQATYAKKIEKQHAHINWQEPKETILRKIRAYNPWPVAFTLLDETPIRIWEAELLPTPSKDQPGTITAITNQGIDIDNQVRLTKIQLPGGKILPVKDILNARHPFILGKVLH